MITCCAPEATQNKLDRKGSFFSSSTSICPKCRKTVQAKILFRDGKVILAKRCKDHGEFEAVLSSNITYWVNSLSYTKPGTIPNGFSTGVTTGCPDDCGLCPDHEQHTCSPIIEISNKCDLQCPICIVWNQNDYNMSVDEFKKIIDGLIEKEGTLELVLLSGGEPTLHPRFFELAEYATGKREIKRVLVSSHGLKLARSDEFARAFKDAGLYLSLQIDSLDDDNYRAIRGKSLLEQKLACLQACEKYNIPTIFVPTVVKGYNDHEIGRLVEFAFEHDFVTSVTIQPAAYTGAGGTAFPMDPLARLTQYDIHSLLQRQVSWLERRDFLPIPCSHPSCYTACYMLKVGDRELVPLTRFGDLSVYLDALTNRAIMGGEEKAQELIQDAIYNLWSAQSVTVDTEKVLAALKQILNEYRQAGTMEQPQLWKLSETKIKAIFIHAFMDEYDFEVSRIMKCCTHYALPDGRLMPGCAYNNIHRHHDKRLGLEGITIPERQFSCFVE